MNVAIVKYNAGNIYSVVNAWEGAWSDAAYREGADAVGTTHIEHLAVGYPVAVSIVVDNACVDMAHNL